ncbi:MAG: hypothetical protein AAGB01_07820 [Cyanobacteria bacterium P01_F01_bin.42]
MSHSDPFKDSYWTRLQSFVCLIPIFGLFPAGWILSRRKSDRELRRIGRLSVALGMLWGLGFFLLNTGAGLSDARVGSEVAMLLGNTVWSSGYFLTLLWLMTRYWRGQSLTVPGVSKVAKYLP